MAAMQMLKTFAAAIFFWGAATLSMSSIK